MRKLTGITVVIALLGASGCGGSTLADTCADIEWRGRQCQALKGVEWAKKHGLPPETVDGYYSLPEDER
jgi:ABC-type dipeptide/oligopeptide/nickel transport system ATPase subunit